MEGLEMKDIYDLSAIEPLKTFPWESVYRGLALADKSVTTFYGDVHSTKMRGTDKDWPNKNNWRWYNALKHGVQVEGFNVNLTGFVGEHWWARNHEPIWAPTANMKYFDELQAWIKTSGIFKHTGRQLFFIQLAGQGSPDHVDFDPNGVPGHLRAPSEFIWLTPPENPKRFHIAGVQSPIACWFNHFKPHGTDPTDRPQWSLRIDGVFTDEFRNTLPK
jgi:hypothetical protein